MHVCMSMHGCMYGVCMYVCMDVCAYLRMCACVHVKDV